MLYPLSPKSKWLLVALVSAVGLWIWPALAPAQDQPAKGGHKVSCAEMEQFLHEAKIGSQRNIPRGVTLPKRATLTSDDGKIVHDASIQTIHESKNSFTSSRGTELNFKDWWEFNVAGYELAKLLDLNMVPPYVERKVDGKPASLLVDRRLHDGSRPGPQKARPTRPGHLEQGDCTRSGSSTS